MEDLKQHLTENGIGYSEKLFASNTGLEGVQEIIVSSFYKQTLCMVT